MDKSTFYHRQKSSFQQHFNPLPESKILDWSKINCKRHFKVHLKWEISKHCTSNFSFSQNVFHSCISLVHQNAVFFGNGLICCLSFEYFEFCPIQKLVIWYRVISLPLFPEKSWTHLSWRHL